MNPVLKRLLDRWIIGQRQHRRIDPSRRVFLRTMVGGALIAPSIPGIIERITIETPECAQRRRNIELLRAMGRGDQGAAEAFAAFISAPILEVIAQAPVLSDLFNTPALDLGVVSSIPMTPRPFTSPVGAVEVRSGGCVARKAPIGCNLLLTAPP